MLLDLLGDLALQRNISLNVHVVECGDDGTLSAAADQFSLKTALPGENIGYCGGNNLVLQTLLNSDAPICIVNPDVRVPDPLTLQQLCNALQRNPRLGAVAPSIRTADGRIEYTGSTLDLAHASAVHTGTHVPSWPSDAAALVDMAWIDGACWMLRPQALREVGLFDERFFLFSEDVDWCLRAGRMGWKLGVLPRCGDHTPTLLLIPRLDKGRILRLAQHISSVQETSGIRGMAHLLVGAADLFLAATTALTLGSDTRCAARGTRRCRSDEPVECPTTPS